MSSRSTGRKTPRIGDEATAARITLLTPECDGRWKKPALLTRKEFAVAIGECWGELLARRHPEDSEEAPAPWMVVFPEHHKHGGPHHHEEMGAPGIN